MPQIFQTTQIARPAYYDRQAIPVIANYSANVVPHATTIRASYSPAYPYAAFIEYIDQSIARIAAAAPASFSGTFVDFLPFFGGTFRISTLYQISNVPGAFVTKGTAGYGYMAYGDTIKLSTQDVSTGGSNEFDVSLKGTEFLY